MANKVTKKIEYWIDNQPTRVLVAGLIIGIIVFVLVWYLMWNFQRWKNYTFGYSSQVKTEICKSAELGIIEKGPNWKKYCK